MQYAGTSTLAPETQQRILGTFEQTLSLAEQGSRQEAVLGCEFILQMDPQFEPARRLLDRLQAGSGAVPVTDLRGAAQPVFTSDDLFGDLQDLDDELPDLPDELGPGPAADPFGSFAPLEMTEAPLPPAAPDPGPLRPRLAALLQERRFAELMALAEANSAALAADPELMTIAQVGQQRMEAEPYVQKFLGKARLAQESGDAAEVERLLVKARSLDSAHPGLAAFAASAFAAPAPTPAPVFAPPPPAAPAAIPFAPEPPAAPPGPPMNETEKRIHQLLQDGQTALDGGDPQGAIDAWSRIFLIDIDHQEAARRIEQARKMKAESERQVEEIFHDAVNRFEAGESAAAREGFVRVLEMQPGYLAARDYLQQIDAGESPGPRPALAAIDTPTFAPDPGAGASFQDQDPGDLKEEILVPPEPGEGGRSASRPAAAPGGPRRAAAAREMSPLQKFLLVGSLVLAVVAAGVYFLYQNKDKFWPNSRDEEAIPVEDPIRRATDLHKAGKTKIAIAQLRRLPPVDPHYQEAQALITQWEAAVAPAASTESTEPGLDPEIAARRQGLLERARQAFAQGSHFRAVESFEQAKAIEPLADGDAAQLAQATAALAPLAAEIELFKQHDWDFALKQLWAKREKDPANADVTRLLIDSYYNLGVRDLQKSDPARAAQNFQEALNLDPKDPAIQRQKRFADTYRERPQDLLFRIYVKYLPYR